MPEKDFHGRVQSVDRAMMLLELLGREDDGNRLTDLANRTGLAPSTVHRLLTTLEQRHFIHFDPAERLWHIGRQAFAVGSAFVRKRNFVATALPMLRYLRDQTRETANLGTIEDGEILLVGQVESRNVKAPVALGGHLPIYATGMGKAVLARYTPEELEANVARRGIRRFTGKTLVRRSTLQAQLADIRRNGYAVDDEEYAGGLRCIASTVYDHQGDILCAISVSGASSRIPADRFSPLGKLLAEAARELTLSLGGVMPS